MSLFVCDICESVDNTALAGYRGYHGRRLEVNDRERADRPEVDFGDLGDGKARCSACNPEVGHWHGRFERRKFSEDQREVVNR